MHKEKTKCMFCHKTVKKNVMICPKCKRDISSMWKEDTQESASEKIPMFCPNPRCHAFVKEGELFCKRCGNDYKKNPPIFENQLNEKQGAYDNLYCPQCGAKSNADDTFCDCGCDFRKNPRVSQPVRTKTIFLCAVCNSEEVSIPDGICENCKKMEQKFICPECNINNVKNYGEICSECISRRPMKGMGEGFHLVR